MTTTILLDGLGIVAIVGGGLIILFGRRSKENSLAGNELIDKLEKLRKADKEEFTKQQEIDREEFDKRLKLIESQRNECSNKIASLQGQIDVLKNVPLGNIDATLIEIRDSLKSSAVILAIDTKDVAEKAKEVKSALNKNDSAIAGNAEIVRLTLLKNTADAALAAALVKTTLADRKK